MAGKREHNESTNVGLEGADIFSPHPISRRTALRAGVLGGIGLAAVGMSSSRAAAARLPQYSPLKGNLKHSVVRWTFNKLSLDELCLAVKEIGFSAISHVNPEDWPTLKKHGVECSMCWMPGITSRDGLATKAVQDQLVADFLKQIDLVADAGYRNTVCFSGNRRGMDLDEGLTNAENCLKRILGHAEKRGVMLIMSMWNSKHWPDYLCDNSAWGVTLCKRVGSPNFRLLYDAHQMQMMEGNITDTIRRYHDYFGYYHTGGVPDRRELTAPDQELNFSAICQTIVETGYKGYLAQEFIPSGPDLVASLREAVHLCDA